MVVVVRRTAFHESVEIVADGPGCGNFGAAEDELIGELLSRLIGCGVGNWVSIGAGAEKDCDIEVGNGAFPPETLPSTLLAVVAFILALRRLGAIFRGSSNEVC